MLAGSLDRRIRIEKAVEENVGGEVRRTWNLLAEVWAQREPLAELFQVQQLVAKADVRYRVRWPAFMVTAGESYRIAYSGRTYDITHVAEIGRREGFELLTWTRADQ